MKFKNLFLIMITVSLALVLVSNVTAENLMEQTTWTDTGDFSKFEQSFTPTEKWELETVKILYGGTDNELITSQLMITRNGEILAQSENTFMIEGDYESSKWISFVIPSVALEEGEEYRIEIYNSNPVNSNSVFMYYAHGTNPYKLGVLLPDDEFFIDADSSFKLIGNTLPETILVEQTVRTDTGTFLELEQSFIPTEKWELDNVKILYGGTDNELITSQLMITHNGAVLAQSENTVMIDGDHESAKWISFVIPSVEFEEGEEYILKVHNSARVFMHIAHGNPYMFGTLMPGDDSFIDEDVNFKLIGSKLPSDVLVEQKVGIRTLSALHPTQSFTPTEKWELETVKILYGGTDNELITSQLMITRNGEILAQSENTFMIEGDYESSKWISFVIPSVALEEGEEYNFEISNSELVYMYYAKGTNPYKLGMFDDDINDDLNFKLIGNKLPVEIRTCLINQDCACGEVCEADICAPWAGPMPGPCATADECIGGFECMDGMCINEDGCFFAPGNNDNNDKYAVIAGFVIIGAIIGYALLKKK
jgi:uncharacterized protein (DUF427 family)